MSTDQTPDPQSVEETKQQIRTIVGEIASLTRQNLEPTEFYSEFLQRVINALAAVGGAVWTIRNQNELGLAAYVNLREVFPQDDRDDRERHARLLHRIIREAEAVLVPPYSGTAGDEQAGNPTSFLLVLAPIRSDDRVVGVVEIFQRPTSGPASQRGYLRFLIEMCNHAAEYVRGRRLQELTDWHTFYSEVDRFSRIVHESLDPVTTAYTIANEGRRLVGCDRVTVALKKGRKCHVAAVSGQDTMDTRANSVVLLGKLATAVVRSGEPLWYTGVSEDLPPQIEKAVHDYVDETHTKTVAVLPLKRPEEDEAELDDKKRRGRRQREEDRVVGAIIVEQIEDTRSASEFNQSVELVCEHASRALVNATDHNDLFLMPVWRTLGKANWVFKARTLPKTLAITAVLLALAIAMFVVPWKFQMEANGKLRAKLRQDVFAEVEGQVIEVKVKHGAFVKKGDVLLVLENPDKSTQLAATTGEIEQAEKNKETYERNINDRSFPDAEKIQLFVELAGIKAKLRSLNQIREKQQREIDALTIRSPIDGEIVTWAVEENLRLRPVQRGQVLMTVANTAGDLKLELFMKETEMGHVRRALAKEPNSPMKVTYVVASDPRNRLEGKLLPSEIGHNAQPHEVYNQSVRLNVEIDRNDLIQANEEVPPDGTEVTAKVFCGHRPVGYVMLHELIEFLQMKVFF
jgi:multidrug efflux pump subunit AcrA (membrane-fusion protein)